MLSITKGLCFKTVDISSITLRGDKEKCGLYVGLNSGEDKEFDIEHFCFDLGRVASDPDLKLRILGGYWSRTYAR